MLQIKDLGIKEFSDLVYDKLEDLKYKPILSNPTTEDKSKALIELHTPLKSVLKTENAIPILSRFQMSITCWNKSQRKVMEMTDEVSEKLQKFNFKRTNTSPSIYDSILQKHAITITFEVSYNSITASFNII